MTVSVKSDAKKLKRGFLADAKAIDRATIGALNEVGFAARRAGIAQMKTKLHKPTRFTLRGIFVRKARRGQPWVDVEVLPRQWEYLRFAVEGGTRRPKNRALVMPVNQKTNAFGNLPRGAVQRHLAKREKSGHGSTFSGVPKGQPHAKPGIYRREGTGKSKGHKSLRLEIGYRKAATYRSGRWPFFRINEGVARNRMPKALDRHIAKQLSRSERSHP